MSKRILFTSFDVWMPHQTSNSSDDLLGEMSHRDLLPSNSHSVRKVTVDFQLAPEIVISQIKDFQPDLVICCGMAESREILTVESTGQFAGETLRTSVNIIDLVTNLPMTEVSHDAGRFVCNFLYYLVLKHIQTTSMNCECVFVHVPILNEANLEPILADFSALIQSLAAPKPL